ncbi:hypothetical protein JW897_06355 [Chromobacterium alkanivorans]|uniref:phage tail tube protein n=1 Tax=Chromobacterium TaxID=535 RepID=UPI001968248D|nr:MULTISPECIES: hypothetical protein [Chromobacterium]MBN3003357.1 hypothetical protein [Chromobacterium alkanivorans]MDH0340622.1 hypothetical protein [Chromobacterium haemolyticum]
MEKLYTYKGKGTLSVAVRGTSRFFSLLNLEKLSLKPVTKESQLMNNQTIAGGQLDSLTEVESVELSIGGISQFHPEVIALLLKGGHKKVPAGEMKETVTAYPGALAPVGKIIDWTKPVTVKTVADGKGAAAKDLTENTDYTRSPAGIRILSSGDAGLVVDAGTKLEITYTSRDMNQIEALTKANVELELLFEGLNAADGGAPMVVRGWRCRLGAGGLDLMTDDFSKSDLEGKLLMDPAKVGDGVSQFFVAQQAI